MDVDENFYDDFTSFIPSADDYNLDELDAILRSTDTQLDASIDMNAFTPPSEAQHFEFQMQPSTAVDTNDYNNFNFNAYPSPAATAPSYGSPAYESQRTSSTSSSSGGAAEELNFNPDDFINFFDDDDFKMELSPADSGLAHNQHDDDNQRDTPSPTGSCTSSIGSGTSSIDSATSSIDSVASCSGSASSGIQSDASSLSSLAHVETVADSTIKQELMDTTTFSTQFVAPQSLLNIKAEAVTLPAVPQQTCTAAAVAPAQLATNYSLLSGTLIPVKTMPLSAVTPQSSIQAPVAIKIEPKLAPKVSSAAPANAKLAAATTTAHSVTGNKTSVSTTTPTNSKPKTIFLSSNDFKALMHKLNTQGKGAKISGNIGGAQMPKIVMKTASGQVIQTGNNAKVLSTAHGKTQFVTPKVIKAPLIIKQHQQQSKNNQIQSGGGGSNMRLTTATTQVAGAAPTPAPPPDIKIYKGIVDEKTMKKQQRMIKNRESASLSRKKKKEYVVSLESRINDLEKENITLKGENSSLRSQLVAFAQTCHCKHGNVSDFILNSLSINAQDSSISCITEQQQHVRIAPKPSSCGSSSSTTHKSIKQRMLAANVKKNVAVLFAMAFMVTLNVGSFQTYLTRNAMENAVLEGGAAAVVEETLAGNSGGSGSSGNSAVVSANSAHVAGRRGLLWVESETEFNEKRNNKRNETELQVPPLHFLRPNRTTEATATAEQLLKHEAGGSKCALGSNQTENQRLASNLHKWIGGNDYLNLSMRAHNDDLLGQHVGFKLKPNYFELKPYKDLPLQQPPPATATQQKRKYHYFQRAELQHGDAEHNGGKQRKLAMNSDSDDDDNSNSLDLFKPKIADEYMRLFKGIKRQDDTFYVLSFNSEHILLPASAYNKSTRPKMALMLPAGDPTSSGDIMLMQIDCEVVNTTELQLKSDMIPEKLRPAKFVQPPTAQPNDVANNETRDAAAQQKSSIKVASSTTAMHEKQTQTPSIVLKPYFMVGHKQQATAFKRHVPAPSKVAAAAAAEEVVVVDDEVEVEALDNFIEYDAHKMRNSTLLHKMRDAIEFLP